MRGYKTLMSFMEFLKAGLGPRYSGPRRADKAWRLLMGSRVVTGDQGGGGLVREHKRA